MICHFSQGHKLLPLLLTLAAQRRGGLASLQPAPRLVSPFQLLEKISNAEFNFQHLIVFLSCQISAQTNEIFDTNTAATAQCKEQHLSLIRVMMWMFMYTVPLMDLELLMCFLTCLGLTCCRFSLTL